MRTHQILRSFMALSLACAASSSMASGSDNSLGAETGDTAAYNRGKVVFASKLACSSCPMAGKKLDAAMARELVAKKPDGLSADEGRELDAYLKRRFKL